MGQNVSAVEQTDILPTGRGKKLVRTRQICAIIFLTLGTFVNYNDLYLNSEAIDIILCYGGGFLIMHVIAFLFLIPLASNRYTRIATYILLAYYPVRILAFLLCDWSGILQDGIRIVNTNIRVWGIQYWWIISAIISFLLPYAYSVIARNNTFKKETNSWVNLLILLITIKCISGPFTGNYNWVEWRCDIITSEMYNTILRILWRLIDLVYVIAFAKLALSPAFSAGNVPSPLEKDFYSPLNRYMAGAVVVLLLSWGICLVYQLVIL